ncbi:MAG: BlaI/MecI/CopY family transcriptional regulator [Lachnospiraceae bacterium]|nr:BlaI/MecI/CopY family transcriptional regulator [Lachnospiraceae bacterium]
MALKKKKRWKLSECETLIMKIIWDAQSDICVHDIWEAVDKRYGKEYAVQTVRTFLVELSQKGFIETYRTGRVCYAHVLKSEKDYKEMLLKDDLEFWHKGKPSMLIAALSEVVDFSKEETAEIRRIIDAMDD